MRGWLRKLASLWQTISSRPPRWASLEVPFGWQTTRKRPNCLWLAGGPWQDHELQLLERLKLTPQKLDRTPLNHYFLGHQGLEELRQWLSSGCYRIEAPEEGALLAVVWLMDRGDQASAQRLLERLRPYFARLRFYPRPADSPPPSSEQLSLLGVAELRHLWLLHRLLELFLATVVDGQPAHDFPLGWNAQAQALLDEAGDLPNLRRLRTFRRLLNYLKSCLAPRGLSSLERDRLRGLLERIVTQRGLPDAQQLANLENQRFGTWQQLVQHGQVPSSEALAALLPTWVATVQAQEFPDHGLHQLLQSSELAFRRRRRHWPLNRQGQLKLRDLPWISSLQPYRRCDETSRRVAHQGLCQLAEVSLTRWPESSLPPRLLQEMALLATQAGLALPLVPGPEVLHSAQQAARRLQDTLYPRYYRMEVPQLLALQQVSALLELCRVRAGLSPRPTSPEFDKLPAFLEQQHILTTENLLPVYQLVEANLQPQLMAMARRCFSIVCHQQQLQAPNHRRYHSARVWRHMVLYLALLEKAQHDNFFDWAGWHLQQQSPAFCQKFTPTLLGLMRAAQGQRLDSDRPFLGS